MLKNRLYVPFLRNSKEIRSFFGGLKSAATILIEPMALLMPKKIWVMDRDTEGVFFFEKKTNFSKSNATE